MFQINLPLFTVESDVDIGLLEYMKKIFGKIQV
jgi:hypothetical protein